LNRAVLNENPRIGFFGSPALAEVCLADLMKFFTVGMVVTQPGKAAGRGRAVKPTPVALAAGRAGVPLYQPPKIREEFADELRLHGIELVVVVAFGKLLPREVIDFPPLGSVNLHASLLPRYRGASPIQAALLHGDRTTGITVQKMKVEMDAGDILASLEIGIGPECTAERLFGEIAAAAPPFLRETLKKYAAGAITPVPQREEDATFCSLMRKEDGQVDWGEGAERICGMIKAFNVWPVCCTTLEGKTLRIYDARVPGVRASVAPPVGAVLTRGGGAPVPGEILAVDKREGILVRTGNGVVSLLELQLENKKRMSHGDFANGYRNLAGKILGPGGPAA
jgi:methionyl-tRNA formyltransferase